MAEQVAALSIKSAKEIKKALDIISAKPTKRKITGIQVRNGDLVITHSPA
jgi:hypothetical protein